MNELEKQLLQALDRLSRQYAEDMNKLEAQNKQLDKQVSDLASQVERLSGDIARLSS